MDKKEIQKIIDKLVLLYLEYMKDGLWSIASDTHDEIRKWNEDILKIDKGGI